MKAKLTSGGKLTELQMSTCSSCPRRPNRFASLSTSSVRCVESFSTACQGPLAHGTTILRLQRSCSGCSRLPQLCLVACCFGPVMVELGRCVESYLEGEVQLARHDAPARSRCSDIAIQVGILAELVQTGSQFCNVVFVLHMCRCSGLCSSEARYLFCRLFEAG